MDSKAWPAGGQRPEPLALLAAAAAWLRPLLQLPHASQALSVFIIVLFVNWLTRKARRQPRAPRQADCRLAPRAPCGCVTPDPATQTLQLRHTRELRRLKARFEHLRRSDERFTTVESGSLEWLNLLVRNLWVGVLEPKLAKQLSDNLQETFDKQAAAKKLKFIDKATVHELTPTPPTLLLHRSRFDPATRYLQLEWELELETSGFQGLLALQARPFPLLPALRIPVALHDLYLCGRLLTGFTLVPEAPGLGLMHLSFLEPPLLHVRCAALGLPLTDLPGVEGAVRRAFARLLATHFVEPKRAAVNLVRLFSKQTLGKERGAGGTLAAAVLSAALPSPAGAGGARAQAQAQAALPPSTYVELRVGDGGPVARTHVAALQTSPAWCQLLTLPVPHRAPDAPIALHARLVSWAVPGEPELIGEGTAHFLPPPPPPPPPSPRAPPDPSAPPPPFTPPANVQLRLTPPGGGGGGGGGDGSLSLQLLLLPAGEEFRALHMAADVAALLPSLTGGQVHPLLRPAAAQPAEAGSGAWSEAEADHGAHGRPPPHPPAHPPPHAPAHAHSHAPFGGARAGGGGGIRLALRDAISNVAAGGSGGGAGGIVGRIATGLATVAAAAREEQEGAEELLSPGGRGGPAGRSGRITPLHARKPSFDDPGHISRPAPGHGHRRAHSSESAGEEGEAAEEREARRAAQARVRELEAALADLRALREAEDVRALVEGARFLMHGGGGGGGVFGGGAAPKSRFVWYNAARRRLAWASSAEKRSDAAAAVGSFVPLALVEAVEPGASRFPMPASPRGGAPPPPPPDERTTFTLLIRAPNAREAAEAHPSRRFPAALHLELPPGGNGRSGREWVQAFSTVLRRERAGAGAAGSNIGSQLIGAARQVVGAAHLGGRPGANMEEGDSGRLGLGGGVTPSRSRAARAAEAAFTLLDGVAVASEGLRSVGRSLQPSPARSRLPSPAPSSRGSSERERPPLGWRAAEEEGRLSVLLSDERERERLVSGDVSRPPSALGGAAEEEEEVKPRKLQLDA